MDETIKKMQIYVIAASKSMIEETERVYRNHIRNYLKREPTERGLFQVRLYAVSFPIVAMFDIFGSNDAFQSGAICQACLDMASEGLSLQDKEKSKIMDDFKKTQMGGLALEQKQQGAGREAIKVFYLMALSDSIDELNTIRKKEDQDVLELTVEGMIITGLAARDSVKENILNEMRKSGLV